MKQPCKARVAYTIKGLLAAATLLVAALLIVQCAGIYLTGTSAENLTATGVRIRDVYSREIVAERFGRISWAFIVWLVLWALALSARALLPKDGAPKPAISPESRWERLRARATSTPAMRAEERLRRNAALLCAAVCAACAVVVSAYFLDLSHFGSRDLEAVMGTTLLYVLPWVLAAFVALALLSWVNGKSLSRELEAAREAPRREPEPPGAGRPALRLTGRVALYVAAVALIIAGILNGGMYDVLVKAINICTECIGLG